MQDIKINVSDFWKIYAKVNQYLRALEQIEDASAAFLAALQRQDSVSYETLSAEWERGIIEHEEKIKERLELIADILSQYLNATEDYVSPRVRMIPMRVDSLDIGFNLGQIERNVETLSEIANDCGGSYADYKHPYIDYLFYTPEQKAAVLAAENAERVRREKNYRTMESFRNNVSSKLTGCMQEALDEMHRIQKDSIEPFDRADTEYGLMMQGAYLMWEGPKGAYEEKERVEGHIDDAVRDTLIGAVEMAMALSCINQENQIAYHLGLLEGSYEETVYAGIDAGIAGMLTDPVNTLEAIGQSKVDCAQENGIAYTVAHVATDIALAVLLDKGMKVVTGGGAKTEEVILNQTDDTLDEVGNFYDDIFEQQRNVDEAYDDFLDDIQMAQVENDVWMTPEVTGGVESGLNSERIEYYLGKSRNNIDSDTVILGSTGKYDIIAETEGYTYFKMSDDVWASLEKEAGGNYDEIWKVNRQFIDEQIATNKNILLSNDPYKGYYFDDGAKRFYQREIDYILSKGYTFESTGDGLWKAVRK